MDWALPPKPQISQRSSERTKRRPVPQLLLVLHSAHVSRISVERHTLCGVQATPASGCNSISKTDSPLSRHRRTLERLKIVRRFGSIMMMILCEILEAMRSLFEKIDDVSLTETFQLFSAIKSSSYTGKKRNNRTKVYIPPNSSHTRCPIRCFI
ncbi:hypothetical protein TSAR_004944 [Trichomalopsis sarcophagae]|uniref:Uncharacterized protein n=1 Tax=Trichomalopsis sarcophagae TaxID=543379 RepID=A0A232FH42_9HYME|nr:hypothetical protein TSAR_004944 [Trichomalopsis sarcophagae]